MAAAFSPPQAQELINAIALLKRDGWLGEKRCRLLQGALEERKEILKTWAGQAVRLVPLMAACMRGDYVDFLYRALPSVRLGRAYPIFHADHFRILVLAAQEKGWLAPRFQADGQGVQFLLAAHALGDTPYRLDYNAMPLAAGFLELFLNAAELEDIETIVGALRGAEGDNLSADERSGLLRKWLGNWLASRAKSEHFTKQSQAFRDFLQGLSEGRVTFWNDTASGGPREMAQVEFPASIRKAVKSRAQPLPHATRSDEAKVELKKPVEADDLARMKEAFYRRQAGNANAPAVPPAPKMEKEASAEPGTGRPEEESRFDGWVLEAVEVDDWHRRHWPAAYAAFAAGGERTRSENEARPANLSPNITDETILTLWSEVNRDPELSEKLKMRKFRTAARLLFDYRISLRLSAGRGNPDEAASLMRDDGSEREIETDRMIGWTSPLAPLLAQSSVNWLNEKDVDRLAHIMAASANDQSAMFGDNYPDAAFARTFLRYVHFGGEQERVAKKMAGIEAAGYSRVATELRDTRLWLRQLACATAYALVLRENVQALNLMEALEPGIVDALKIGTVVRSREDDLAPAIRLAKAQLTDGKNPVGKAFRDGFKNINRAGFRKDDSAVADFDDAFSVGAECLPLIADVVDDVLGWLIEGEGAAGWLAGAEAADAPRFRAIFARMYETGAAVPA